MERFLSAHLGDETRIDFERYAEKKVRDCELRYIVLLVREARFRPAGMLSGPAPRDKEIPLRPFFQNCERS